MSMAEASVYSSVSAISWKGRFEFHFTGKNN